MTSPASTSCPSSPYPFCVWGLGARGGRGRSGYSRCDCHFLHLDPLHYTTPFCTLILSTTLIPSALAASDGEEVTSDGEEAASDGEGTEE